MDPYDQAALQAVSYLQSIYGFVVLDYSVHQLLSYASVAQNALCATSDAIRLASATLQARDYVGIVSPQLVAEAHRILCGLGFVHYSM
jgi:hypothetical protein